jgi:hypothetical protein
MGRRRQRKRRRQWLNEASRKKVARWWDNAGWEGAQVDWGCWCRGSFLGRIAALCFGFSDERWPFLDENRRKEESRLTFFGELMEASPCISRLFKLILHAAPQLYGSLRFLAGVAPGVHGADELECMGPAKVLLENNRVSNHERAAQGKLRACAHVIIDAAQLVDLHFDSRVCNLPRQNLNLVPCEASGWVVQRQRVANEIAVSCPENCIIAIIPTLGCHSSFSRAEH